MGMLPKTVIDSGDSQRKKRMDHPASPC